MFHLTYSAAAEKAAREVYVQRFTVESGNLKMNVARGSSRASIQKRHGNTATLELVNNSFELFEEIPFKVSERFHFACGLPL